MPKKTKKQKLAAEKRKSEIHSEPKQHVTVDIPQKVVKTSDEAKEPLKTSTSVFKKELYKSLLISGSIILVEIGIYLAQNKGISIINFQ